MNKIFKIFNKEFSTKNICTINYTGEKLQQQRALGMQTVLRTQFTENFIAQVHGKAGNNNIDCILVNGAPSKFLAKILSDIYWKNATKEIYDPQLRKMVMYSDPNTTHKYIYYKENNTWHTFIPNDRITAGDRKRDNKQRTRIMIDEHTEELYNGMRIPEERKAKMMRYIKYYDLDIPQTEPQWVETFHQLAYYIKNNIGYKEPEYTPEEQALIDSYQMDKEITYGFDNNQYYICEECGELVNRGTDALHCCYCELPVERTKIDYLVNGGE